METSPIQTNVAAERLAAELADVRASISLVSSGVATGVTLVNFRFARQIADMLAESAQDAGVDVEIAFWTDDSGGDVHVRRHGTWSPRP